MNGNDPLCHEVVFSHFMDLHIWAGKAHRRWFVRLWSSAGGGARRTWAYTAKVLRN